jgi:hypothetical protein
VRDWDRLAFSEKESFLTELRQALAFSQSTSGQDTLSGVQLYFQEKVNRLKRLDSEAAHRNRSREGFTPLAESLSDGLRTLEQGLAFSENFDSKLESLFARRFESHLRTGIELVQQAEVKTLCGSFYLDFVAITPSTRVAFECDGRDYHDPWRDEFRDAMILGAEAVDSIYRLRGSDLYHHMSDCLYVISIWNPELFDHAEIARLEASSSETIKDLSSWFRDDDVATTRYGPVNEQLGDIHVTRRRRVSDHGERFFWKCLYDFAKERGGGKLEKLMAEFDSKEA